MAATFRYRMNIFLPLWVGSLNFSPLLFFLWLLSLSLSRSLPLYFFLSLPLSLSLSLFFCSSLWVLRWTHIVFGPNLFPYVSSLFSPSCILISLPIAILLSGCFGKNGFPGLLCFSNFSSFVQISLFVSHLLCLSLLCVLWDETCPLHSLSLRLDHMLHCLMILGSLKFPERELDIVEQLFEISRLIWRFF